MGQIGGLMVVNFIRSSHGDGVQQMLGRTADLWEWRPNLKQCLGHTLKYRKTR